jgi:hypothetical protein
VDELNKNIDGPVKDTVSNAMGRTVEAAQHVLEAANEKLNNPEYEFPSHGSPQDPNSWAQTY